MKYSINVAIILFLTVSFHFVLAPTAPSVVSFQRKEKKVTIVAVGDIMLGRFVEDLSLRNNDWMYPFASTSEIFSGADIGFANFEGTIPKVHQKTPLYGYQFSVQKPAVLAMKNAGINVVSLANNHSHDFGVEGYQDTILALDEIGIASVGSPADYLYEKEGIKIRFMGFNDTFARLPNSTVSESIRIAKKENEFLIVTFHFGEEYATTSNARQKELARVSIDSGADVVIGHHPHVVQEMETYHGKPIFYSLGNFIFDQYFSEETQKGLAVKMIISEKDMTYEMMPIDLYRSRPTLSISSHPYSSSRAGTRDPRL